jgi:hypothetical protein
VALTKIKIEIFFNRGMTICTAIESPDRVVGNILFLIMFNTTTAPKNPKILVGINLFIRTSEK